MQPILKIVDCQRSYLGAKGIRKAVDRVFEGHAVVQRCQWHKRENVIRYLGEAQRQAMRGRLPHAYNRPTLAEAKAALLRVKKELAQARNLAQAAKEAKVAHVIWSTLEDTRKLVPLSDNRMPTLGGRYKVPHFDAKGEADRIFTELGVPTTFLLTSFYWDNLIHFGMGPKKGADGKLAITFPMGNARLAGIASGDIGRCAYGIFKKGRDLIGKTLGIAGEHLTCAQMAAALAKALGQPVRYNEITPEEYRGFGFPGADDLGNMFQVYRDFETEVCGARKLDVSRSLNPELQTFEQWLAKNKDKIPLE
jgi:hypothetical protein